MSSHETVNRVTVRSMLVMHTQRVPTDPAGVLVLEGTNLLVAAPATISGLRILDEAGDPVAPDDGTLVFLAGSGTLPSVVTLQHGVGIDGEKIIGSNGADVIVDPHRRAIQLIYREFDADGSPLNAWTAPDWS